MIAEALLLKIIDVGLFALEAGIERSAITDVVAKHPPEDIPAILNKMVEDSLARLDEATRSSP